jgi:hypothetical protein
MYRFKTKMKLYTDLENLALRHLAEQRQGLRGNREMSMKQVVEFMSSSGFFYYHGVHSRRNGIGEIRAREELELSVGRVIRQVGFYVVPDAEQRRDILHPPFESFTALKMVEASSAVGEVVTQLVVNASEVLRPDGPDADIIQFPASPTPDLEKVTVVVATA